MLNFATETLMPFTGQLTQFTKFMKAENGGNFTGS